MLAAQTKILDQKVLNVFSWICVTIIVALTAFLLSQQAWKKSALIMSVMAPAVYFIFAGNKKVPALYVAIFVGVTLFNVVCMGWGLYSKMVYMDDLAHFLTAFALVPCSVHCLLSPVIHSFRERKALFAIFGFCIGITVGALWEVFEYILAIEASYADTVTDLIFDGLGAAIAATWAASRLEGFKANRT